MKSSKLKKIILFGLLLAVMMFTIYLFINKNNFFGSYEYSSGIVESGSIERMDQSVRGQYKEADGEWKYSFVLEEGKYSIHRNVYTKSGTINIRFIDDKGNTIIDLSQEDNTFSVESKGRYYLDIILSEHSGNFDIEIEKE